MTNAKPAAGLIAAVAVGLTTGLMMVDQARCAVGESTSPQEVGLIREYSAQVRPLVRDLLQLAAESAGGAATVDRQSGLQRLEALQTSIQQIAPPERVASSHQLLVAVFHEAAFVIETVGDLMAAGMAGEELRAIREGAMQALLEVEMATGEPLTVERELALERELGLHEAGMEPSPNLQP